MRTELPAVTAKQVARVAVKVIDLRGNEVIRVLPPGGERDGE